LRACLRPRAEMVVSSWMRRSLARLRGSMSRSGRREVTGLLHVRGEVRLSRRVDTLVVMLVAGGADPHIEAALADGDEVTRLPLLGEVVRNSAKKSPIGRRTCPLHLFFTLCFRTTFQNHPPLSFQLASITLTFLAPTFMTSPYPVVASSIALPVVLHVLLLTFYQSFLDRLCLCALFFCTSLLFVHALKIFKNNFIPMVIM